jgi:hypothetical protein
MIRAFLLKDDEYTDVTVTGETKREAAEYIENYLRDTDGIDYRVGFYFNVYKRFMPNESGGYSINFVGTESEV